MAWINTSTICSNLYITLVQLNQIDPGVLFDAAGAINMSQLLFFNSTATSGIIKQEATSLAAVLDSTFTNAYLAAYMPGQTQQQAITGLINTLINAQNTVTNLSDAVATYYQFIS